jgi:hypothetical protein
VHLLASTTLSVAVLATALTLASTAPSAAATTRPDPVSMVTPTQRPAVRAVPRPVAPAPSRVYVFGDSLTVGTIMYGSPSYLSTAMHDAHLTLAARPSAKVGRRVGEGLALLPSVPDGRRTALIALGTNDVQASADAAATWIRRARELLGPGVEIFWVNLRLTGARFSHQTQVNAGLLAGVRADDARQVAAGHVGRSHVLDWYSYARDHHVANRPDGIHYSLPNYRIRAIFYAESLAANPRYLPYRLG